MFPGREKLLQTRRGTMHSGGRRERLARLLGILIASSPFRTPTRPGTLVHALPNLLVASTLSSM